MEFKFEKKDLPDWIYRGEGAANLVLAYTGSSPTFIGKVMRIQKVERDEFSDSVKKVKVLTDEENLLWRESKEIVSSPTRELAELLYVQNIMSPLLGPQHVDAVTSKFLECIEEKILSQRPPGRVDDAKVDTQCDHVIIMSDHSVFPRCIGADEVGSYISVEIKPKCGFIPSSRFISSRNRIKKSMTRFRMHQVLKLQQHEVSELSQYDPLDIFFNSIDRIDKAINDLYATPQNNFRVFLNGSLIFGGLGGTAKKSNFLVKKAFEDALKGVINANEGFRTTNFLDLVAKVLHSSQVLDRLLEVQKLDNLDIEGAIHAYYNIVSQPCKVCRELDEPNEYASLHCISMDESLKIVRDYLVAATAKDCSLMITFRPRKGRNCDSPYSSIYLQSTRQNFEYKMNFLDLDLKPLKKMEHYYEKDKKIVDLYSRWRRKSI